MQGLGAKVLGLGLEGQVLTLGSVGRGVVLEDFFESRVP